MTDTYVEPNEKQPKLDEYFSSYEDLEVSHNNYKFPIQSNKIVPNFRTTLLDT